MRNESESSSYVVSTSGSQSSRVFGVGLHPIESNRVGSPVVAHSEVVPVRTVRTDRAREVHKPRENHKSLLIVRSGVLIMLLKPSVVRFEAG